MRKYWMGIAVAALFYISSSVLCLAQVNLLQNGNFERRTISGIPDSWTRSYSSTGGSSSRSTDFLLYGDYVLRLIDGSSSQSEGVLSAAIPVTAGVSYTAEAYIYRTSSANAASLYIRYYDVSNTVITSTAVSSSTVGAWGYVSKSLRAPINASYAKLICYSPSTSTGTMYFDAVSFFRSATQSMVDNPAMDLDAVGSYPVNWENYYTTGEPVSVVAYASKGHVMALTDNSTTLPAASATRRPVIGNMTYTASAEIFWVTGSAPSLYIKYRDENDNIVGSAYVVAPSMGRWTINTVTMKAPEGAVEAQLLAITGPSATGTAYFANFNFEPTGFINKFVAPSALGTGTGGNASNAAKYNDANFWATVQSLLATQSVIVDFRYGDYAINNNNNDKLNLTNIGTTDNALVLKGRNPFGSVFTRTSSADTSVNKTMVELSNAKNIVIRHLHWEDASPAGKINGYGLVINTDTSFQDAETRNITLEGCSFVGMTQSYYGAMGFHDPGTHNGTVWNCEFVNIGFGSHSHMIYNAMGSYNLETLDSYFEDSPGGAYVRHAHECHDVIVEGNKFVDTGVANPRPFLEVTSFNDTTNDNQMWAYNLAFINNSFTYPSTSNSENVAIRFLHYGYNPVVNGVTWYYLLDTTARNILLTGTTTEKKSLVKAHYNVDFDTEVYISGNTRIGYHAYDIRLATWFYLGIFPWTPGPGDGDYDISDLGSD